MRNSMFTATAAALVLVAAGGCGNARVAPLADTAAPADAAHYHLGAGDKLRITVYNEPALTGEYNVTPAGAVAFPLIGSIDAANRTIEEVTGDIARRLDAGYVHDPKVSIEVLNFRPFYILGEVNHPGEYPYSSGLTVEQAVALAGGFTYRANSKTLFVRRDSAATEGSVSLRGSPVSVLPGDTIRVGQRYF